GAAGSAPQAVFSLATASAAEPAAPPSAPAAEPAAEWRRVTGTALNVRQGPSAQEAVVGRLLRDEVVLLIDTRGGWSRIRIEGDGIEGWVANRYLTAAAAD
ncbi:MAG: SH3 domain-containing protein, partial [Rhodobacterales bacterium]|nr:SH3 domain-containing protein [Rhodobacterales bacterium]